MTTPTIWHDCYGDGWQGVITKESFAHPAKFSKALIERIFDHCLQRGWLRKGDLVGDCFGGIGNGGIIAAYRGLNWIGVELEPRFVKFAEANFELHAAKWRTMGLPMPRIVQGDSREFHKVVDCAGIVTSPPYADSHQETDVSPERNIKWSERTDIKKRTGRLNNYSRTDGQIGRLKSGDVAAVITSPPYADSIRGLEHNGIDLEKLNANSNHAGQNSMASSKEIYGKTDGQIARLPSGSAAAVVTSPPYAHIAAGAGGLNTKPAKHPGQQSGRNGESASQSGNWSKELLRYGTTEGQIARLSDGPVNAVVTSPPFREARSDTTKPHATKGGGPCAERLESVSSGVGYGESSGQIDSLKTGSVDAVVTSPPWEKGAEGSRKAGKFKDPTAILKCNRGHGASDAAVLAQASRDEQKIYGDSEGQIGNEAKETYWQAMAAVYASCYAAIKPGGVIAVVVKDYVSKGKRVPLCDDTARLLEHCGFVLIERVHAMLTKETRHGDLFNGETVTTKSRKSFFRRLAEKKGSPPIDFEEVLFFRRP